MLELSLYVCKLAFIEALIITVHARFFQEQPSKGVLRKRCSEKMQQIYRTPMPNCDLLKSHFGMCSPVNLLHIFWTPLYEYTYGGLLPIFMKVLAWNDFWVSTCPSDLLIDPSFTLRSHSWQFVPCDIFHVKFCNWNETHWQNWTCLLSVCNTSFNKFCNFEHEALLLGQCAVIEERCVEVVGSPKEVEEKNLEGKVLSIFGKVVYNIKDCHQ